MHFEVLLKESDLRLFAEFVGDEFQFLSGVDICQLASLEWIEIATSKSFLKVNSDYLAPAIGLEDFWGFEVAFFETEKASVIEAESRLKQGWVYLEGCGQIVQDVLIARVTHREATYELKVDQAIVIVLESRVIAMQFTNLENLIFEVKYFDDLKRFEDAFLRHAPEGETWDFSLNLISVGHVLEEINV
jgi:hypothetical protein